MTFSGKTVLVTGATGFLGSVLALRLAAEGAAVKALARSPQKAERLQQTANIEIVTGDITDAARMVEVTRGCEIIFHVAAALGGNLSQQRAINVDGTRKVMLAAGASEVQRVVAVSSVAVYGYGYRGDVTEAMPHKSGNVAYNVTKSEGEDVVREIGEQHRVPYSIIRPGMIYGPRSNMWTHTVFRLAKRNPTPFVGDGSGSAFPIFVDDVVDLMTVLGTHPAAEGEAFNCAPDPSPTWREFISEYSRLAGHQGWLAIPVLPLKILAPLGEFILGLRGEPQDVPAALSFMQAHTTYKTTKAHDLLGWQPKVSLQEGVQLCAPWLREQGLLE